MRILVVGQLNGQLASAVKRAMAQGANVNHVETNAEASQPRQACRRTALLSVDDGRELGALYRDQEVDAVSGESSPQGREPLGTGSR